jgi:hypothetical protein
MKKTTEQVLVVGGLAAVGAVALAAIFWPKSASAATASSEGKKDASTDYGIPGATRLPTHGKQAAPDPWTGVEFKKKDWPSWWPPEYQPW